jgi:hypothetical protein
MLDTETTSLALAEEELDDTFSRLDFLAARVREAIPVSGCSHGTPACLSCALEWLVVEQTPVSLFPPDTGER